MNKPMHSILSAANTASSYKDSHIGHMLVEQGKLTLQQVETVRLMQKREGLRFGEAAKRLGLICEDDIQQVLSRQFDYPYLQDGSGNFPSTLIAAYRPFSVEVEELRSIRSQLMSRWFSASRKKLAVTSVNSGDGTSLLTANLAVVFAQLGVQTLVVDANLRAPRQHHIFNLPTESGLADVLAGRSELNMIEMIDSFVDLSLLPAGSPAPNPQELLNRASFNAVNQTLCERFDVVLYDTPALLSTGDALAVAARAGGVLLVIRKDHTRISDLANVSDQLRHSGAEIVGSVMVSF